MIAVDAADRLYVAGWGDGRIYIHDSSGEQVVAPIEYSSKSVAVAIGPGDAVWGDDLYVLTRETGELLRFDIQQSPFQIQTTPTVIGTGFHVTNLPLHDLEFGPDGALYVSELKVFADGQGRIVRISLPIQEVVIDIKPGEYPNPINLGSHGVVPVAILSSETFDATTVDENTVELAGAGVAIRGKAGKFMAHEEDVDGDGLMDLVVHVETENFEPEAFQDGYARLSGETIDGQQIEGYDEIIVVPPE